MIELLFTDEQIERATNIPPKKTRALLRSNLINDNSAKKISLKDLCWDKAEFIKEGKEVKIEFLEPLEKEAI